MKRNQPLTDLEFNMRVDKYLIDEGLYKQIKRIRQKLECISNKLGLEWVVREDGTLDYISEDGTLDCIPEGGVGIKGGDKDLAEQIGKAVMKTLRENGATNTRVDITLS